MKSVRKHKKLKRRFTPALTFGMAALIGSMAWAEEEASVSQESSSPAIQHDEVVVEGETGYKPNTSSNPKYTEPLRNIPQTITVIPEKVMQDQGATTLRQVLRNVPGISMQAGEGGVPAGDNLAIRGFNARTDFFIDGMRDIGGYTRDSFNLESVEVAKGPTGATTGRGSTGGSINQISKYPEMYPEYNASVGFGTDNYRRITVDANQPVNDAEGTAVRVTAMVHENDTPRRDAVENKRWGVAPSIAFGLNTPTRFTLGYYHLAQDNVPDYGVPFVPETNNALPGYRGRPAPVDLANFYGLVSRDYEKTEASIWTGKFEHDFNQSLTIDNITRMGSEKRDSVVTAPRFVSDSTTTINRQIQSRDQEDDIIANQTNLLAKFQTGFIGHDVVLGAEFSREDQLNFARTGVTNTTNLYYPNPNTPFNSNIARNGTKTQAVAETSAYYAFDTFKLGEHWEVPAGVRWESFGVRYSSAGPTVDNVEFERTDRMLSGKGGIVFKPSQSGSIYAGFGSSFNPSTEGLTSGFTRALADVEPEKSYSYEVGTKWDLFKKRLAASFALFRTEKTNARTPGQPGEPPTVLNGEQRVDGVEIGASGNLTRDWQLFSGVTFMDSEVLSSNTAAEVGKEVSNTPKSSFSVWTTYAFPSKLNVGGGVQYVSSRYANATNTREVGSYITYDAMISYPVNDRVTLRANGYNLTNEEFYDSLGGGHLIPGAGRSATITTDIAFGPRSN